MIIARKAEPGLSRKDSVEMRRRTISIWIFLGAFVAFSICLPLGHVCLNKSFDSRNISGLTVRADSGIRRTQATEWRSQASDRDGNDEVCQTCLLTQNLHLKHAVTVFAALRPVAETMALPRISSVAKASFSRSASNRAPPTPPLV